MLSPGERGQLGTDQVKAATAATALTTSAGAAGAGGVGERVAWSTMPTKVSGGKACLEISSWGENPSLIPCGGFYGLDEPDIRECIEALPHADVCCHPLYRFTYTGDIREGLINECKGDLYRFHEGKFVEVSMLG